jgi:ABC-type Fe3+ transport system permease subunit
MEKLHTYLDQFFSFNIFYQFMGAIIAIAITVTIVFLRQYHLRKQKYNYYKGISNYHNLGDINVKVDEDLPYEDIFKIIFRNSFQPLLLIFLLSFINTHTEYSKFIVFIIVLISTMIHEFMAADEYLDKKPYRLFIIIIWVVSYFAICNEYNIDLKQKDQLTTSTAYNNAYKKLLNSII